MNIHIKLLTFCILFLVLTGSSQAQNTHKVPNNYMLSINVGSNNDNFTNFTVSLVKLGKFMPIPSNEADWYSSIFFNHPKDILWASCIEGYKLTKSTSKFGAHIIHDPAIGAGIVFSERQRYKTYNLTISCSKKT